MAIDDVRWRELLELQEGVVTRTQALVCGWHRQAIAHRLGGIWQRLLRGVFLTTTGVPTWRQKAWAGLLYAGHDVRAPAALTSWSGLASCGLEPTPVDVHVSLPHRRRFDEPAFLSGGGALVLHRTTRSLEARGTMPTLPVERCVVDACLSLTRLSDVRAVTSKAVQRGKTTPERLLLELQDAPQRGSGLLRLALSEVAEGARSAPEAVLARALRGAGLPPYRLNGEVRGVGGELLARADVVFDDIKLVVEVDGQRWHLSADRWIADVARHTRLEAEGWTVLRYPASRVLADVEGVIREIAAVATRLSTGAA